MADSLYDTIAGFFKGKEDAPSPREREMVMSPEPPKPVIKPGESQLDFNLRMMKYNTLMKRRKDYPEEFMVAGEGTPVAPEEVNRFNRRQQIEQAVEDAQ